MYVFQKPSIQLIVEKQDGGSHALMMSPYTVIPFAELSNETVHYLFENTTLSFAFNLFTKKTKNLNLAPVINDKQKFIEQAKAHDIAFINDCQNLGYVQPTIKNNFYYLTWKGCFMFSVA